jgi:hypothetical protein
VTGADAQRGVRKLDPKEVDTHHRIFRVSCDKGHMIGLTWLSLGSLSDDIGTLANDMARQLHIPIKLFRELVECTAGRSEYLAARDHLHPSESLPVNDLTGQERPLKPKRRPPRKAGRRRK